LSDVRLTPRAAPKQTWLKGTPFGCILSSKASWFSLSIIPPIPEITGYIRVTRFRMCGTFVQYLKPTLLDRRVTTYLDASHGIGGFEIAQD